MLRYSHHIQVQKHIFRVFQLIYLPRQVLPYPAKFHNMPTDHRSQMRWRKFVFYPPILPLYGSMTNIPLHIWGLFHKFLYSDKRVRQELDQWDRYCFYRLRKMTIVDVPVALNPLPQYHLPDYLA
ncbi:hypothetical protein D3C87_1183080 [compost metagenome]